MHPEISEIFPKVDIFKQKIGEQYKPSKFLYFDLKIPKNKNSWYKINIRN